MRQFYLLFLLLIIIGSCGSSDEDADRQKQINHYNNQIAKLETQIDTIKGEILLIKKKKESLINSNKSLDSNDNNIINQIIVFVFIGLIIGVILRFLMKKDFFQLNFKRPVKNRNRVDDNNNNNNNESQTESKGELKDEKSPLSVVEKDFIKPKEENQYHNETPKAPDFRPVRASGSRTNELVKSNTEQNEDSEPLIFYLQPPFDHGKFDNRYKSLDFINGLSVYVCEYQNKEKTLANFKLVNDQETLDRAINFVDSYLLRVCDDQDSYTPSINHVIFGEEGYMELEGAVWNVHKKAKIMFTI